MHSKTVLITGGAGSLGQALVKRLLEKKAKPVVFSRDEGKHALAYGGNNDVRCIIGDVRDINRVRQAMSSTRPDYVIHAAALKRVDDIERFPYEAVQTNIQGSNNVCQVASECESVRKAILVSTDKACSPVNVYGSTKFIAERLFSDADYTHSFRDNAPCFASVRYGNVIASRGSFIPAWTEQIRDGKTINITSSECTRFLFTLNDAVDNVLLALNWAQGGEVFIPKMNSFNIVNVAHAIAEIEGRALKFTYTGLRPGEKLHEDLVDKLEASRTITSRRIHMILPSLTKRVYAGGAGWKPFETQNMSSLTCLADDKINLKLKQLIMDGLKI